MLVVAAVLTTVGGLAALQRAFVQSAGFRARSRYEDVSAEHLEPPAHVAKEIAALQQLGYRRIGEMRRHTPSRGAELLGSIPIWVLLDADGTIVAEVSAVGPLTAVELCSVFLQDGRVVVAWLRPLPFRLLMICLRRDLRSATFSTALPLWGGAARADRVQRELIGHVSLRCGRPRWWDDVQSFADWSSTRAPKSSLRFVRNSTSHA